MTKKILLFLFLLSALPLAQLKSQTYTHYANGTTWSYTVNEGNATIIGASPVYSTLNIPAKVGTTPEYDVTAIGFGAFFFKTNITNLTVPSSVTSIEDGAFQYCEGLTGKLQLPNVTTIGGNAFNQCIGLTGLDLPNVTTIGSNAFHRCRGLNGKLELPNVTTIGSGAFSECKGLTKLELPNVTTIAESAFANCEGLTKLELPKVTTIGISAFDQCRGLNGKLELPNVTTIGVVAFSECNGLTELDLPKVEHIDARAFTSCIGLTGKLELPKTLKSIGGGAFSFCRNITSVTFESGTNLTSLAGISSPTEDSKHFEFCTNLQYIDMSGVIFPSDFTTVSRNSSIFQEAQPYTMVYLPSSAPTAASGQENFVIGNTCDKFVVYDKHAWYKNGLVGCDYYNSIIYPFTATTAEYINRDNFYGQFCKTLCLPYAAKLPIGMRAYKLLAKTGGGKRVRFVSVGDGNGTFQIEANTPYLIRIINGWSYTNNNWLSNNVNVPVTPANMEVALPDGQTFFGGTTTNIDNATAASRNLYNLSNDTWYPIKTSQPNGYVHSFRAYIRTTGGTPAKGFAMVLDDDENATTDIDNAAELTEEELRSGKHTFYTIDGRRAGTNYDELKSGEMYVVKGQKFYKF